MIYTGDYGAAGAVDLYGAGYGLPHAISGHNSYWWWGPAGAHSGATTIAVNLPKQYLQTIFTEVTPAGTLHSRRCVDRRAGRPHLDLSWPKDQLALGVASSTALRVTGVPAFIRPTS